MKKLILLISIVGVFNSNFFSQDIIFTKSQTEIKAKVLEITTDAIKYKEYDFLDGPTRNIVKSDVFMIEYSSGKKEFISKNEIELNNDYAKNNNISKELGRSTFGFKFGLGIAVFGNSESTSQDLYSSRTGGLLGATAFFPISKKIDIRTGLFLTFKGSKLETVAGVPTTYCKINYLEIPMDFAFKLGNEGFALSIGPYFAFLTNASIEDNTDKLDLNSDPFNFGHGRYYNPTDFGLNLGLSWMIANKFHIELRYSTGLVDITTYEFDLNNTQINGYFGISFGLQF